MFTCDRRVWPIAILLMSLLACEARDFTRPKTVPEDAVFVSGGNPWWWIKCEFDSPRGEDVCVVFNKGGEKIIDGGYVPYGGGPAIEQADLQINANLTTPEAIWLMNGFVLIHKETYSETNRLVERQTSPKAIPRYPAKTDRR